MTIKKAKSSVGWFLFVLWIIYLYGIAYYYFVYHISPAQRNFPFKQQTIAVPLDFKHRLHFHGLDREISVIEIGDGDISFVRDGKKCPF